MWDSFIKFINDNKEFLTWLFGSGVGIAFITGLYRLLVWFLKAQRKLKKRTDISAFKVLHPNSNIAKEILGGVDNDLLADRNIPYQQRIKERNIHKEIEEALEKHKWVLVAGKTGIGKTREVLSVAQTLNNEGWTVLFLTREQWLDAPPHLPENVPDRKLLFILDDLNRKMYASQAEQSPHANDISQPITEPLQKRLLRTLETFQKLCGKDEIRIIATVRNETVREYQDEPSEWEKLEIDHYPQLWKRFYNYLLSEPEDDSIISLLEHTESLWLSPMNSEDFRSIAKMNDQTFTNIIENLRRAKNRKEPLSRENFVDSLNRTWESHYEDVIKRYPEAKFVYGAIRLLRLAEIELYDFTVEPIAELMVGGNLIQKIVYRFRIARTLAFLEKTENILKPRDGQIEASTLAIKIDNYIDDLGKLLLNNPNKGILLKSFHGFAQVLLAKNLSLDLAENLINIAIKANSDSILLSILLRDLGAIYIAKGRKEDAKKVFKKSNELFPYCFVPWQSLILEGEIQEAQEAFDNTIQTRASPVEQASDWVDLGEMYRHKGFLLQSIDAYKMAIKLMPNNAGAWQGLAYVYLLQDEYNIAIDTILKAVELDPNDVNSWYFFSRISYQLKQYDNAIAHIQKAIDLDPNRLEFWATRALVCKDARQYDEAIKAFQRLVEAEPESIGFWNSLCTAYRESEKYEEAVIYFNNAILANPKNALAYHELGHIRNDQEQPENSISAFLKAIELEPKREYHLTCLGNTYLHFAQTEHAFDVFRKALELNPKNDLSWIGIGNAHRNQNNFQDSIEAYNKAIDLNSHDGDHFVVRGSTYALDGMFDEALQDINKAIEIDSKNDNYVAERGRIYRITEKYDESIQDFNKAIELRPKSGHHFSGRARVYILTTRNNEALQDLNRAIELAPASRYDWLYYLRALAYKSDNNLLDAGKDLDYAINASNETKVSKPTDWQNTLKLALYNLASSNYDVSNAIYNNAIQQKTSKYLIKLALLDLDEFIKLFPKNEEAKKIKVLLQDYIDKQT